MVLATRSDSLCDFHSQLQSSRRLKSGDQRLASGACAFNERDQLLLQRFLAFDWNFVAGNFSAFTAKNLAALFFVIEREIGVLLKYADLAHPLGADSARGHIGNAT